jgi:hypothetical protein
MTGSLASRAVVLAERGELDAALGLAVAGLRRRGASPEELANALDAARRLAYGFRIDDRPLVVALAGLVEDAATREAPAGRSALMLLCALGSCPEAADAVFAAADVAGPDEWADIALAYLAVLVDPRVPRLLARDLRYRPFALNEITCAEVGGGMRPIEFGTEIFEAVHGELRSGVTDPNIVQPLLEMFPMWGRDAAAAVPDVVSLANVEPLRAAYALLAIADPVPAAIAALRQAARDGTMVDRLAAGTRLRELTGDDAPLLAAIRDGLGQTGSGLAAAAAAAAAEFLGSPPPAWVVPVLRRALSTIASAVPSDVNTPVLIARALWYLGKGEDTDAVLPVIAAGLRPPTGGSPTWPSGLRAWPDAIDAAGSLGPAGTPLIPDLVALLDDPCSCPRAARALRNIDGWGDAGAGGVPLPRVTDHLVTAADFPDGREQYLAVALLRDIGCTRLAAVSPEARVRLRDLAERPRRVIRSGSLAHVINDDGVLRFAIRNLLSDWDD